MFRQNKTRTDVLGRAMYRCVASIEIHLTRVFEIPWHHRSLEEMDVLHPVNQSRCIVKIRNSGIPIRPFFYIDHMHGCACGAEIHSLATQVKVIPLFLTMKYDSARSTCHRILDKRPRKL